MHASTPPPCIPLSGQVLDDSTKAHVRNKVDDAAAKAVEEGHPVQVCVRGAHSLRRALQQEGWGWGVKASSEQRYYTMGKWRLPTEGRLKMIAAAAAVTITAVK